MSPSSHEVYIKIDKELETTVFCLRRMETVADNDCRLCFDAHEQLQAGYRQRFRCAELHWIEIAAFLPSSRKNRIPNGSDSLPCPAVSHPSKEKHSPWT